MAESPLLEQLIEALRCLPGVGPKSAQRMAFHLLQRDRDGGRHLAEIMRMAMDGIGHCRSCRTLSETELCRICSSAKRNQALLCVVETPADVSAIEHATHYQGVYFVLMGHLSPLDGIGPEQIGLHLLKNRLELGDVGELILATNPTVEGEATAHYISDMAKKNGVRATRIAHGVPLGGELEFVDSNTLSHAFTGRHEIKT